MSAPSPASRAPVPTGTPKWTGRDLGPMPVLIALAVLWLVFQAMNPNFLSADNLVNLTLQVAPLGMLTLGVVLVLLVGQVDLSTGAVSGLAAAVTAVGIGLQGWPGWLAVVVAVAVGAVVGYGYGWLFTRLGVPSFVLTLAGLLVTVGIQLRVLGATGSVNLPFDSWLVRFGQEMFLPDWAGYAIAVVVVGVDLLVRYVERRQRLAVELPVGTVRGLLRRTGWLSVVTLVPTWYLQTNRGIGASVAFFLLVVLATDLILTRTRPGRAVRAVGSNADSARRAGLAVRQVYVATFVACSSLAAAGGVMLAGRLAAANQTSGGSDTNLTVIAAAVIGGTSLFGGRGSAWSAPLGVLVIGTIWSGLTLLNLDASPRYIVTGLVLAFAVTLDALSRRRAQPAAR